LEQKVLKIEADSNPFIRWVENGTDVGFLQFLGDNAYLSNMSNGSLFIRTNNTDKMTILSGGNVGIGTTSPDLKLDVTHATAGEYVATFQNTGSNLELKLGVTSTGYLNIQGQQINNSATFNMSLQADGGNVGINTTIPTQKLHVVGNARVTGAYYDSNNSPGTANQVLVSTVTGTDWIDGSAIPGVPAGSGTLNTVAMWTPDGDTLGNSNITQSTSFANDIIIPQYVRHTSDTNTYFGFGLNDTVNFGTAGSERMRITSTGNVGIKTTSPANPLSINFAPYGISSITTSNNSTAWNTSSAIMLEGASNSNGLGFGVSGTANDRKSWIQSGHPDQQYANSLGTLAINPLGGNVGIGTTSPDAKLTVNGNGTDFGIRVNNTSSGDGIRTVLAADLANNHLLCNQGGINIFNLYALNDNSGKFIMKSGDGTDKIKLNTTGDSYFNGGNVGIGTTSPSAKLHVSNSSASQLYLSRTGSITGTYRVGIAGATNNFYISDIVQSANRLVIDAFGNVGIGTNSPTQKLHIVGNARVTGAYYDSNNSPGTANQVLVSTATGTDWVDGSGSSIIGGPYLPLAGGTMTGDLKLNDAVQLKLGTGNDLRIYHSGTNSNIENNSGTLQIIQNLDDGDIVFKSDNGGGGVAEYFRLDGGIAKTVFSRDAQFLDNAKALFGNSYDLQIYHDGSNSYIKDTGTGILAIQGNIIALENTSGVNYFVGVDGAQAELYYNGSSQLQTTSTGVAVTGDINIDSALLSNQENTDVDTGTETVASVAIATYTAAFFDFVIKKTTNVRSGTVYACHDGTNVEFTETSTQDLGDTSDVTLSVDISGGNMRLRATTTSDDWSIKSLIRAI